MMKRILKAPIALLLALLARAVVRKYHPKVVMVTGSVGKTSTKDAVAAALSAGFFVRKSEKSYNSEFGVPLTIFGAQNPWLNPLGWLLVFKEALALILLPNHYPNMLVLEVGADRPGDLAKILRITAPDAVVVTKLPEVPVHVEAYSSPEAVREEEFSPAYHLAPSAPLVYLAGDEHARRMSVRISARPITYGTETGADVRLSGLDFNIEEGVVTGMRASVATTTGEGELVVRGSVGKTQVLPAAAAIAVAGAFGIELNEAITALENYEPPPGRGRIFKGKNGSILIDDTYNSSPAAVEEALATLKQFPHAKRRLAVLGDMLELGRYSVAEHERIGALVQESADIVVTVGIRARRIAEAAVAAGLPAGSVHPYDDARNAALELSHMLADGDIVLVKGSQSVRMERIALMLLANPADATRLVRQEKQWQKRG